MLPNSVRIWDTSGYAVLIMDLPLFIEINVFIFSIITQKFFKYPLIITLIISGCAHLFVFPFFVFLA